MKIGAVWILFVIGVLVFGMGLRSTNRVPADDIQLWIGGLMCAASIVLVIAKGYRRSAKAERGTK